jgi:glyoxylase-like metal-dependent hydrolase (beta-lactamase superfamily II)
MAPFRTDIGDFELTSLSDGIHHLDGGAYFSVVPKTLWSKKLPPDENNRVPSGLNSVLIRTGDRNVLIETASVTSCRKKMAQIYGQPAKLLDSLHAVGLAPEDVDIVINSHLHFDHCGWNTIRQNGSVRTTFPNAKYYAQEGEWQHAHEDQRDSVSFFTENYDPLVESGQCNCCAAVRKSCREFRLRSILDTLAICRRSMCAVEAKPLATSLT